MEVEDAVVYNRYAASLGPTLQVASLRDVGISVSANAAVGSRKVPTQKMVSGDDHITIPSPRGYKKVSPPIAGKIPRPLITLVLVLVVMVIIVRVVRIVVTATTTTTTAAGSWLVQPVRADLPVRRGGVHGRHSTGPANGQEPKLQIRGKDTQVPGPPAGRGMCCSGVEWSAVQRSRVEWSAVECSGLYAHALTTALS